jgi:TPP-dependent pyruvate/acetoin dehydrogenase alpha subunit
VMAEMFAKSTGCCKGMGGSMHIADYSAGMLGANGIVAAGIPNAAGAGLSCQVQGKGMVSAAFFGDGATNEGAFHEAVNLAAVWKLPVLFVCENNIYGFSTHYRRTMAIERISDRAGAYGIPGVTVDGQELGAVYAAAGEAVRRARAGNGPTLLECKTYRYMGHSRFEPSSYRTKEEVEQWKKRDPIALFRAVLRSIGASEQELAGVEAAVDAALEAAVRFAEHSPDPGALDWKRYIFAGGEA